MAEKLMKDCIANSDALENSMTPTPDSKKNSEEYFKGVESSDRTQRWVLFSLSD